ncbi:MAG: methionyl-tRNA formyltransferase [Pseudorhodobacter sp.]|nr:methionyl-tRNA formyltransferase [Rhizobacter sp.]
MTEVQNARLRVAFAGTPEFAQVALVDLHAAGFEVPLVLTQPDRPAGRGMKLNPSPVKAFAQAHGMPVAQPRSLRLNGKYPEDASKAQAALVAARVDVMVVAAYGLILPQWVLDLPSLGCLNIHASLLPRWRGAAPIHRAIEAGDAQTGITLMQMDAGLDTGDMLQTQTLTIAPDDTTARLHDRLAALGGRMLVQVLRQAAEGTLVRAPQPLQGITYAHKIDKAEGLIDWRLPAEVIARRVRAFDPFPGASTTLSDGTAVKIWRAVALASSHTEASATVLAVGPQGITVACGEGALCVTELQRPGGKRLAARDFLQFSMALLHQRLGGVA